jgi:DNA-binding transcriptional LysR family regulator
MCEGLTLIIDLRYEGLFLGVKLRLPERNMLEVRDLRLVVAIATHGSLVRAGRVLGISASGATRALAALEARLDARLFERSRLGVIPTDACRALIARADAIVTEVDALEAVVSELRGRQDNELTIAGGPLPMETVVSAAAARFIAAFPATKLILEIGFDAPRRLHERRVDLAVAELGELDAPEDFDVIPLRRHPILLLARPDHPLLTTRGREQLVDVFRYPFVTVRAIGARIGLRLAQVRQNADGGEAHSAFPAVAVENIGLSLAIAAQSDAIAAATAPAAKAAITAGAVTILPWRRAWMTTNFGILTLRRRALGAPARAMIELVKAEDDEAWEVARRLAPDVIAGLRSEMAVVGRKDDPALR